MQYSAAKRVLDKYCTSDTRSETRESVLHHAIRSLQDGTGTQTGTITVEQHVYGSCSNHRSIERFGRPSSSDWHSKIAAIGPGTAKPVRVISHVRCRKCENCLKARAYTWRLRSHVEIAAGARTWFSTFTLSPASHFSIESKVRATWQVQGIDFDTAPYDLRFREIVAEIYKEFQKYWKRVRKQSGATIRYLLVTEAHKSGLPHFHALVHETSEMQPVRKKVLNDQWTLGFSSHKLVPLGDELKTAAYLCKYLTKSNLARARASVRYGHIASEASIVEEAEGPSKRETTPDHRPKLTDLPKPNRPRQYASSYAWRHGRLVLIYRHAQ